MLKTQTIKCWGTEETHSAPESYVTLGHGTRLGISGCALQQSSHSHISGHRHLISISLYIVVFSGKKS